MTMAGHRPSIWDSDLYGAQQGHADLWQVCLAHQLRDCQYAIEAGDTDLRPTHEGTRCYGLSCWRGGANNWPRARGAPIRPGSTASWMPSWCWHPPTAMADDCESVTAKVRSHLFTSSWSIRSVPPDNNGSERELRPTATYRKVTGGFRSTWGADLFAGVRSVIGTAARQGKDAYQAILAVLDGESAIQPG